MPKSLTFGNGSLLAGLDKWGQLYDLYFPHVGLENHVGNGYVHKLGVFVDNQFSWLDDSTWQVEVNSENDSQISMITARNPSLAVTLHFNDGVYNERNIFIRHITIGNERGDDRLIKIFFNHQFEIYESHRGDTAYFDPIDMVLIHYKGRRMFLANLQVNEESGISEYSVGLLGIEGKEGTYKDAEDGHLTKNPIEHGLVDSVCSASLMVPGESSSEVYYWLAMATTKSELYELNEYVIAKTPSYLLSSTRNYWKAWVSKENFSFYGLSKDAVNLFNNSLFAIRSHMDNGGGIIASGDSDMLKQGRDTYSYVWPRDASFTTIALDKARYNSITRSFFEFCTDVISEDGYMMHKYRTDKSLGSSWHPWLRGEKIELPIQEDETALVLIAFWKHYEISRQLELVEEHFNPLIRKAADFMENYVDIRTGLPRASYDIWEEKFGVSTFTCAAVAEALEAAGKFSKILGKENLAEQYSTKAQQIREAIITHLYNEDEGYFYKMLNVERDGSVTVDNTLDMSSVYAAFKFHLFPANDERLTKIINLAKERLWIPTEIGGYPRYENDNYFRLSHHNPSNPWFITILWMTQYYISIAEKAKDLDIVMKHLEWVTLHATNAGVLSEQINPYTGEQLSAAPLTWSHAEYVVTIIEYLEKLAELGVCKTCIPST